ncbi:helix-turn-helix domain-containing protein [Crenobacter caeni]|uniref:helix-turn-helix domain-containing protein n=1 Tax=Crenobacter caeni TaxID=2705474 RepID=UPI00193F45E2|nr:helix-turn-helix transcriptional regulator [Crenobacter caeni]
MSLTSPFPQRLKQARVRKGLTQQQLGVLLGLDPNNASARMNQYERGKHAPDFATLKRIAELLDVPVAWFYCEDDLDASIVDAAHQLTAEQKQALLSFIEQLRQQP